MSKESCCTSGVIIRRSTLQQVEPNSKHCNTLQYTTTHCNTSGAVIGRSTLQHTEISYNTLHRAVTHRAGSSEEAHCNTLKHAEIHFNTLKKICNTLQHTVTHCNTLLHVRRVHQKKHYKHVALLNYDWTRSISPLQQRVRVLQQMSCTSDKTCSCAMPTRLTPGLLLGTSSTCV